MFSRQIISSKLPRRYLARFDSIAGWSTPRITTWRCSLMVGVEAHLQAEERGGTPETDQRCFGTSHDQNLP